MRKKNKRDILRKKKFELLIFAITFFSFGILLTLQMFILRDYITYQDISTAHYIATALFWIVISFLFTILTIWQINYRYRDPIEKFAEATEKVANGDFSVYVPHKPAASDRSDFLDRIFSDFNKMVEELGSIETLKTDFFSNVSHEIKTPLAAIQNYAEMLQKDNLTDAQRKEYAENIQQSTKRLSELITNILKLNKLEKQTIHPLPEPYDLCAQLCACALQFEDVWEHKRIEFVANIEDQATIDADQSLMELVWNNLLSNAFKFTESGGTVRLTQASTEQEIIVIVSDTGCGMSKGTAKRIFDKFYQGDTSHATEGNGLGLALVARTLQLVNGEISVESTLGAGTTFTVRIPLINPEFDLVQ